MNNNTTGVRSLLWAAASVVATIAVMIMLTVVISPPPADAETPAERCKRETTAYNNAWKNTWAQANPGKSPSQAPPPPVPYKCGGGSGGPPPPPPTTSQEVPGKTGAPTKSAPEGDGDGDGDDDDDDGPNLNTPTERRELEHPDKGQPAISTGTPSTPATGQVPSPSSNPSANDNPSPVPPNELLATLLRPHRVACTIYDETDCQWYGNDPVNVLIACSHFQFKDEDLIVRVGSNLKISCGAWLHIARKHFQQEDPRDIPRQDHHDFLTCMSNVSRHGSRWERDGKSLADPPNRGLIWQNPRSGTWAIIVIDPKGNLVSAWTLGDGKDWGGCAK